MKYKIAEYDNEFTIYVKVKTTTGMLWWKKPKSEWIRANICGGHMMYNIGNRPTIPVNGTFKSLKSAKKQIKRWKQGIKYHNV